VACRPTAHSMSLRACTFTAASAPARLALSFFYGSAAPRHLHSFPARRSSDLLFYSANVVHRFILVQMLAVVKIIHFLQKLMESRSEEHTSELQSRFDLVCRLLLEKKKKGPPCRSVNRRDRRAGPAAGGDHA